MTCIFGIFYLSSVAEDATGLPPPLLDKRAIPTVVPKPFNLKTFHPTPYILASSSLKVRLSSYLYVWGDLNRNVIMDVSRKIKEAQF